MNMKLKLIVGVVAAAVALTFAACGNKEKNESEAGKLTSQLLLKNDSTVYGLVCDGCTDSVLVLLPSDDSDPVKYDIIDATQNHKVFGKLKIGDWVGIVLDPDDPKVADIVIDLDQLKGTWCYKVLPQFRDIASMSKRMQRRMMKDMPDSVRQTLLVPREYGFTLKRQFSAIPVGFVGMGNSLEDESPVVYPDVPFYNEWHIWNGKLILTRDIDHGGNQSHKHGGPDCVKNDTADFVKMTADTLVLAFRDHTQGYYRHANAQDVNKEAREAAAKQAKRALDATKSK